MTMDLMLTVKDSVVCEESCLSNFAMAMIDRLERQLKASGADGKPWAIQRFKLEFQPRGREGSTFETPDTTKWDISLIAEARRR